MKRHISIPRQADLEDQIATFGDTIANLAAHPARPIRVDRERLRQAALQTYFRAFHKQNRHLLRQARQRACS